MTMSLFHKIGIFLITSVKYITSKSPYLASLQFFICICERINKYQFFITLTGIMIPAWLAYWQFYEKNRMDELYRLQEYEIKGEQCIEKRKGEIRASLASFRRLRIIINLYKNDNNDELPTDLKGLLEAISDQVTAQDILDGYQKMLALPYEEAGGFADNLLDSYYSLVFSIRRVIELQKIIVEVDAEHASFLNEYGSETYHEYRDVINLPARLRELKDQELAAHREISANHMKLIANYIRIFEEIPIKEEFFQITAKMRNEITVMQGSSTSGFYKQPIISRC